MKLVLEFMAPWSEPCKFMKPSLLQIAARFKDDADFYMLDVEQFKVYAHRMLCISSIKISLMMHR